ncbi:MAG: thioredoxin domain-containing protein, partial [Myxococcaceae bacterium]
MFPRLLLLAAALVTAPALGGEPPTLQDVPHEWVKDLSPAQRFHFMRALQRIRAPGCDGTLAECVRDATALARKAAELAGQGKDSAAIVEQVRLPPTPKPAAEAPAPREVFKVPVGDSFVRGSAKASVTLVAFTDYQCPFCKRAERTVAALQEAYGDKVRVVVKHNPLPFHLRAEPTALAALAAGRQQKFWEMHDRLFADTDSKLEDADLEAHAKAIGLNLKRFRRDLKDPKLAKVIDEDQSLAADLGANGTPTFFINGWMLAGAQPEEKFRELIEAALVEAEKVRADGVPATALYEVIIAKGVERVPKSAPQEPVFVDIENPAEAPSRGPANAKVVITMWTDFECPFCNRSQATLKALEKQYGKKLRIVVRHQPLPFHPNAKHAAEASMAAHEQGKFWAFHDLLFENQRELDPESLEKWAKKAGLDLARFNAALESGRYRVYVETDSKAGNDVGAEGTPTFFINSRKIVGAMP